MAIWSQTAVTSKRSPRRAAPVDGVAPNSDQGRQGRREASWTNDRAEALSGVEVISYAAKRTKTAFRIGRRAAALGEASDRRLDRRPANAGGKVGPCGLRDGGRIIALRRGASQVLPVEVQRNFALATEAEKFDQFVIASPFCPVRLTLSTKAARGRHVWNALRRNRAPPLKSVSKRPCTLGRFQPPFSRPRSFACRPERRARYGDRLPPWPVRYATCSTRILLIRRICQP